MWQRFKLGDKSDRAPRTSERWLRVWVRERVWQHLPLFVRPVTYFLYRYLLRGGLLDGKAGLVYTFLQGFWLNFLIDTKYYELVTNDRKW